MFKNAMASAAALGLILASTAANAEAVRATAALPGVVSVNKHKVARTAAPRNDESLAVTQEGGSGGKFRGTYPLAALAGLAAGVGTYFIVRGDKADVFDTPGG